MAHGHHQKRCVAPAEAHFDVGDEREMPVALMAAYGTFRLAGRARGVHQRPGLGRLNLGIRLAVARRGKKVFVGAISGRAGRGAEVNEIARRDRKSRARPLNRLEEIMLNDQRRRLGVLHDVADLLAEEAKVDRHHDQSGLRCCPVVLQPLDAIVSQHCNAVALRESHSERRIGESTRPPIPFPERHRAFKVAGADLVR
jgi:hypothetical protein